MKVEVGQKWVSTRNGKHAKVLEIQTFEIEGEPGAVAVVLVGGKRRKIAIGKSGLRGYTLVPLR